MLVDALHFERRVLIMLKLERILTFSLGHDTWSVTKHLQIECMT